MSYLSALDGATSEADLLRRLADLRAEDARLDVDGVSGALVAAGAFFGRRKRAHFVGICERTLQDHALVKIESARNSEQALVSLLEDIGDSVGSDARVAPHALRRFRHDDLLRRLLRRFPKTPIPASLCHVVCELEFAQFATQMLPLRLAALESSSSPWERYVEELVSKCVSAGARRHVPFQVTQTSLLQTRLLQTRSAPLESFRVDTRNLSFRSLVSLCTLQTQHAARRFARLEQLLLRRFLAEPHTGAQLAQLRFAVARLLVRSDGDFGPESEAGVATLRRSTQAALERLGDAERATTKRSLARARQVIGELSEAKLARVTQSLLSIKRLSESLGEHVSLSQSEHVSLSQSEHVSLSQSEHVSLSEHVATLQRAMWAFEPGDDLVRHVALLACHPVARADLFRLLCALLRTECIAQTRTQTPAQSPLACFLVGALLLARQAGQVATVKAAPRYPEVPNEVFRAFLPLLGILLAEDHFASARTSRLHCASGETLPSKLFRRLCGTNEVETDLFRRYCVRALSRAVAADAADAWVRAEQLLRHLAHDLASARTSARTSPMFAADADLPLFLAEVVTLTARLCERAEAQLEQKHENSDDRNLAENCENILKFGLSLVARVQAQCVPTVAPSHVALHVLDSAVAAVLAVGQRLLPHRDRAFFEPDTLTFLGAADQSERMLDDQLDDLEF